MIKLTQYLSPVKLKYYLKTSHKSNPLSLYESLQYQKNSQIGRYACEVRHPLNQILWVPH